MEPERDVSAGSASEPLIALSYVVPWRSEEPAGGEAVAYLQRVAGWCEEVIVVDGSPAEAFEANSRAWGSFARHVAPEPRFACLMGKVAGVLTGLDLARHEHVVLADDDVRYTRCALERVDGLLQGHDLVRPQNHFDPLPWHAVWDSARSLLNRALGADFPGTLGVRRSLLHRTGGYDGNVMFENLELIRTVTAAGGRTVSPLDLYVRRLPPTASHFWGQRTRQAYDDFAIPLRMALWLAVVPALAAALARRRLVSIGGAATALVGVAEIGRRRGGGRRVFPVLASLCAPAWVLERGVCAWLAVLQRVRFGGVRYGNSVIPLAAHSERELRQRLARVAAPVGARR
ncbi:MAG TPA: glycosyltransferase [Solirubrobacteraceae bacterium]|nr:glycosyltransferase [Solirubrobacteraceae bacterium]